MIINLKIPDALFEAYIAKFTPPNHYAQMKDAIEAFSSVEKGDRVLMLHGDARRAIEAVFQTTLDTPEKLLRLLKNMNTVKIQNIEVNFDEVELNRIKTQAAFHGRTTEQFIVEMVQEIKDRMLEKV
jgi:hypothetical protein